MKDSKINNLKLTRPIISLYVMAALFGGLAWSLWPIDPRDTDKSQKHNTDEITLSTSSSSAETPSESVSEITNHPANKAPLSETQVSAASSLKIRDFETVRQKAQQFHLASTRYQYQLSQLERDYRDGRLPLNQLLQQQDKVLESWYQSLQAYREP